MSVFLFSDGGQFFGNLFKNQEVETRSLLCRRESSLHFLVNPLQRCHIGGADFFANPAHNYVRD